MKITAEVEAGMMNGAYMYLN